MTASVGFLTVLIGGATALAALAPLILFLLWLRDARKGRLW
jgi:hypothetical protein